MYYEAATTKGIIIHTHAAVADWIQYLAWNDDCRKQTRHSCLLGWNTQLNTGAELHSDSAEHKPTNLL